MGWYWFIGWLFSLLVGCATGLLVGVVFGSVVSFIGWVLLVCSGLIAFCIHRFCCSVQPLFSRRSTCGSSLATSKCPISTFRRTH